MIQISDERLRRYSLSRPEFERMYWLQRERCGCCEVKLADDPDGVAVDHDHVTDEVRGLLCRNCNTLIGRLGDDVRSATKKFLQIAQYLTTRRRAVDVAIRVTSAIANLAAHLDECLVTAPTWTSRLAILLAYEFTRHNVAVPHRDEPGFYGCGSRIGKLEREQRIINELADNKHQDIPRTNHIQEGS